MKTFAQFVKNEDSDVVESVNNKKVTLTGGGKTISLSPGQKVSFVSPYHDNKKVTGVFEKKVSRGGRHYAHVSMPDNTAMHVPPHHISEEVEQVDEAKAGIDHSTFAKQYKENESKNYHSENVVLMAKHFGSKSDHMKAVDILNRHKKIGHLPQDLAAERHKLVKKLWPKAQPHMSGSK